MKFESKLYIVVASSLLLLITMIYQGVYAYFEAEVINTGVRNTSIATKTLSDLQIIDGTTSHYLRTGNWYWTLSPSYFDGSLTYSKGVYSSGHAYTFGYVIYTGGVRPVLSLKPEVTFSGGNGTMNNPLVVSYN